MKFEHGITRRAVQHAAMSPILLVITPLNKLVTPVEIAKEI
jgi:hypothetical protein